MNSLVSSSFCSSPASQVCLNDLFRKCIGQSSYRENPEQWSIPGDIIYELVLYTKYHYSKAPSPGVNDCFVSFVFFGIDLPVKSSDIDTTSREKSAIPTGYYSLVLKELY